MYLEFVSFYSSAISIIIKNIRTDSFNFLEKIKLIWNISHKIIIINFYFCGNTKVKLKLNILKLYRFH